MSTAAHRTGTGPTRHACPAHTKGPRSHSDRHCWWPGAPRASRASCRVIDSARNRPLQHAPAPSSRAPPATVGRRCGPRRRPGPPRAPATAPSLVRSARGSATSGWARVGGIICALPSSAPQPADHDLLLSITPYCIVHRGWRAPECGRGLRYRPVLAVLQRYAVRHNLRVVREVDQGTLCPHKCDATRSSLSRTMRLRRRDSR